jgi:hypothetical protein
MLDNGLHNYQVLHSVQAVFGFFGALESGRGCRLYLLFSRGGGVVACFVNLSRAEVDSEIGSGEFVSGSSDRD